MSTLESIKIAISAIRSSKLRAGLTMLGLIIGVLAVILLVGLGQGVKQEIASQIEGMGANLVVVVPGKFEEGGEMTGSAAAAISTSLTNEDIKTIRERCSTCKLVSGISSISGTARYRKKETPSLMVLGTDSFLAGIRGTAMDKGRFIRQAEAERGSSVVVLGNKIAQDLFVREDPIGREIDLDKTNLEVIGVAEEVGAFGTAEMGVNFDEMIYIPFSLAQKIGRVEDKINRIIIQAASSDKIEETQKEVKKILVKQHGGTEDFSVLTQKEMLRMMDTILGMLTTVLAGIASISLVVGGIGIMNIMLVSVTERTREVGIRKAVGAKNRDILGQFLIEAVTLSLVGGGCGVLLAWVIGVLVSPYLDFNIVLTLPIILLAFGISASIGIIFGTAPAVRASRLNPVDALRYE